MEKIVSRSRRGGDRRRTRGASLGLKALAIDQLIDRVEEGLPFKALLAFEKTSGVPLSDIAAMLRIPPRTIARRRVTGRLAGDESERLLRLATIFEQAVRLFEGDVSAAREWLSTPKKALGNRTPFTYSRTELGAHEVEALIGRLEHGVFS